MRWYWFDRFTEFESGFRAVGIKNVTLAEEHVFGYVPGFPTMPNTLVVEGLAQVGGLLVGEMSQFEDRIVLAKVAKARFHFSVRPGDRLVYTANIENHVPGGALINGKSHVEDQLHGEVQFYLATLTGRAKPARLFEPADLFRMLRILRLYEVGRDREGNPLRIPERFREAIAADQSPAVS